MPPAFLNHRVPTACGTPTPTAASSLAVPAAIAAQNRRRSSRPATGGRPGENKRTRPERSERRFRMFIATPVKVLRRPLESALGAAIAMMDEAAAAGRPSVMKRLFEGVEDKVRMRCPAGPPTDDPSGIGVDDEGDIDEAGPGRDIGKIREPQTVWSGSMELSVHVIQRTESRLVADRCPQRLPRIAPRRPIFRINRATVQRAALKPSRRN